MTPGRMAGLMLGVLIALASARPPLVAAQAPVPGGTGEFVGADLPPDHWVMGAVRRAEALGILKTPLPFRQAISTDAAAAALEEARERAAGRGMGLEALTEGWRTRFYEEFGGAAPVGRLEGVRLIGIRLGGRVAVGDGLVAPGFGEVGPERTGAVPLDDEAVVGTGGELSAALGRHLGLMVEPEVSAAGAQLRRMDVVLGAGNWSMAAGRQHVGLGKSSASGVVLSGEVALDRIELRSRRPRPARGPLVLLGPVGVQAFLSRLGDEERHLREPYLWGGSISIQPFSRLGLAVHRAAMFGGRGHAAPVTLQTFLDMLIGRVANLGFENQIVSVEGRYRLPSEEWLPLTAFFEWGAEDAAGGWWDVPARVIGLESPAIPGLESLSAGASFTSMAEQCCGNSPWYRHGAFSGNWAAGDRPLGHPLGGEGSEWLVYGTWDRMRRGVIVETRVFRRRRKGQNLYSPAREGSHGAAVQWRWRGSTRSEVDVVLMVESGPAWTERRLGLGAHLFF